MKDGATIVEGMAELKLIQRKMTQQADRIHDYAAILSTEKPQMGTEEAQEKEIETLIQSNEDLVREWLGIKSRIEYTNLITDVTIDSVTRTISEWLSFKGRKSRYGLGRALLETYRALNDESAQRTRSRLETGKGSAPTIVRLYDENQKYNRMNKVSDLLDKIDSKLEVVNAVTPLAELP